MTLEIKLQTPKKPFIAGGPIRLELSLHNTGDADVKAPAYEEDSQFEYLLLTEDGSDTIESITARKKELARGRGLRPRPTPEMQTVQPGGVLLYRDDLAKLVVHPISPGKYQVEALYRLPGNELYSSNRVPIEIITSRPSGSSQELDVQRSSLTAFELHRESDGQQTLRKWESRTADPRMGRFQPLHTGVVNMATSSLAMAIGVEEATMGSWHWLAWTSGNNVQAQVTRAVDVKYPSGPLDTGLIRPVLLEHGYQFPDGHGLFLLTGIGSHGRHMRLLTLPADDETKPTIVDVPLPRTPDEPADATYFLTPGVMQEVEDAPDAVHESPEANANADAAARTKQPGNGVGRRPNDRTPPLRQAIALSWILRSASVTGFVMTHVDPATAALIAPPRTVFSINREVLAHALPPVAVDGMPNAFTFLLAPTAERATYTRLAMNVHDTEQREEWDLPTFTGGTLMTPQPQKWIMPSRHSPNAPVVAIARGQIWTVSPKSGWNNTGIDASKAVSAIRLWSMPAGEYWCSWFDAVSSYQLHRVA